MALIFKSLKYIFLISLVLLLPYRYFTAPPPGFCVAQNRFIPAEDFIKIAIESREIAGNDNYKKTSKRDGKELSVAHCCVFRKIKGNFYSRVFRKDTGVWVFWAYEKQQQAIDESYDKEKYGATGIFFDSCLNFAKWNDERDIGGAWYSWHQLKKEEIPNPTFPKEFVKWPK